MPPKRSLSGSKPSGRAMALASVEQEPQPEPEQPPGYALQRGIRSASEACPSVLAEGAGVGKLRECCICLSDWLERSDQLPAAVIGCENGHFTCVECLASYVKSEMSAARLAKNSGRVGCASCYDSIGPITTEKRGKVHVAFTEKQLRDTLRASDALSAYERGQQRLVERLLLEESLACPKCGYFELVDRPEVAIEYRIHGRVWACAGCGARSCHRCLPATVVATEEQAHRCRRNMGGSSTENSGDQSEQQLYHRLTEVLTKGCVGYCPRGCPSTYAVPPSAGRLHAWPPRRACPSLCLTTQGCHVSACVAPLVKDQGCNCMQCVQPGCGIYFCFLCNADLGDDSREAHRSHFRADSCWMFDGGDKTLEVAHAHRTHALVYATEKLTPIISPQSSSLDQVLRGALLLAVTQVFDDDWDDRGRPKDHA